MDAAGGDVDAAGGDAGPPSRVRFRTSRRVVLSVAGACLVFLATLLWQAAGERTTSVPLESTGSTTVDGGQAAEDRPGPSPAASGKGRTVTAHVAGAVRKPGVVSLPEGSRVFEALEAAGGATADAVTDALNLAEPVADGAKITVPVGGSLTQTPEAPVDSNSAAGSGGKININTASAEELATLPRVGPVMAQRIVAWRKEHGRFSAVEDLDAVDGIGPKLLESLRPLVTVQGG